MSVPTPRAVLLASLATAAYLIARLFVLSGAPVLLGGDQGFFWMYGERMLHGELPYRDFFQFTPPGADLAYLLAFKLFGPHIWVTNAIVVLLGSVLAGLSFRLARGVMSASSATLATSLFVVFVYGQALTGTHHWWSMLFVLSAIVVLGDGATRARFAIAGAVLGVAAFCTQTHGVAALVAVFVFAFVRGKIPRGPPPDLTPISGGGEGDLPSPEVRDGGHASERCALALVSFLGSLAALWAFFVVRVGVVPIVQCVVTHVWRFLGAELPGRSLGLPESVRLESLPWLSPYLVVYALVPIALVLAGRALVVQREEEPVSVERDRRVLLWLVGVALVTETSLALTWVRLFAVSMPAVLLSVWLLERSPAHRVLQRAAWALVAVVAILLVRSTQRHHTVTIDLPAGRVAVDPAFADELTWLAQNVAPGTDAFAADRPNLYLPLALNAPLYLDAAVPGRPTTAEHVDRAILELERSRVPYVIWSHVLDPEPKPGDGLDAVRTLHAYVHEKYRLLRTFAVGEEVWVRK